MRIDDSTQGPWAAAAAPAIREQTPQDATNEDTAAASAWTGDDAFRAPRAAARLAEAASATTLAATVDPAPVGGASWLAERGAALFGQGRPMLGMKDGLPIVGETEQEHAQGVAYLTEQLARRGQDTANLEFITVRVPVFDGATGPKVGWFEGTAVLLDASSLKAVGPADLPENIASALRTLARN